MFLSALNIAYSPSANCSSARLWKHHS